MLGYFRPLQENFKPIWRVDDNTYQLVHGVQNGDVIMEKVISTDFSIQCMNQGQAKQLDKKQ